MLPSLLTVYLFLQKLYAADLLCFCSIGDQIICSNFMMRETGQKCNERNSFSNFDFIETNSWFGIFDSCTHRMAL